MIFTAGDGGWNGGGGEGRRMKGEEEGGKESGVGEGGRAGCDLAAARINKK